MSHSRQNPRLEYFPPRVASQTIVIFWGLTADVPSPPFLAIIVCLWFQWRSYANRFSIVVVNDQNRRSTKLGSALFLNWG